jgi:negative regulator of sigma E activity
MEHANDKAAREQQSGAAVDQQDLMQISALADSALEGREAARAIDALLARPDLREAWAELHMVGDCLRSDETGAASPGAGFLERFKSQLALEATVLTPRALRADGGPERWRRVGLPAVSIAAAVAMVTWVAWPQRPITPVSSVASLVQETTPASTVTRGAAADAARPVDAAQLREYLAAHEQFSSPQLNSMGSFHTAAWSTGSSDNSNP